MKQIYTDSNTVTLPAGVSGYVYGEKISPGMVLRVENCFAYSPQREAGQEIILAIRKAGQQITIRAASPGATQKGLATYKTFWIDEGHQLFAFFPYARYAHELSINVTGVLYTFEDWQKMRE